MKVPELLCPAGNRESLEAALHFGADAVYGGMKHYGLRAYAGNFDGEELRAAIGRTHECGARFYVTMNIFPFDDEMEGFVDAAREARDAGADAVIVSDPGAIRRLRRELPELPVHVSTQANTVNTDAVKMYRDMGCERVILAREMSLERIARMKEAVGDSIQLETFVHGASCMAYSGRCMLSAYLTGRSGNRGECAQPCRWQYAVMEEKRPGVYLPVEEDERGTYLFSAKDLCLMPILPELAEAGVSSLKIEGRMKTEYYVAVVTGAYRRALDLLAKGREAFEQALPELAEELKCASHRDSDTGFLLGRPEEPGGAEGFHQEREFCARVTAYDAASGEAQLLLKNRSGEILETLGIAGETIRMELPGCEAGDILRGPVRNHRR